MKASMHKGMASDKVIDIFKTSLKRYIPPAVNQRNR